MGSVTVQVVAVAGIAVAGRDGISHGKSGSSNRSSSDSSSSSNSNNMAVAAGVSGSQLQSQQLE